MAEPATTSIRKQNHWILAALGRPGVVIGLALLAAILTLPSLGSGLVADDDLHRAVLTGSERFKDLSGSPLDLFNFLNGDRTRTLRLMDKGVVAWWTNPDALAAFWRPLASFTHWLDYRLWPRTPALMHAQSIAWFALGVSLVTLLYRRLIGPGWIAGLAGLLYAIDDARSVPVGFLANRNALMAVVFGTAALILHDRWRKEGKTGIALGAFLCLLLSLLSAELGISTFAYLLAYTLFLDRGKVARRWLALLPYVAIIVGWRMVWTAQGYGMRGMGAYVDPLTYPLRFMQAVIDHVPVLLLGQWWFPPGDLYSLLDPNHRIYHWAAAVIVLLILTWLLWPTLRRDALAKFLLAGMLLAAIPVCSTFPSDRILGFVGIGAMGLLARFLAALKDRGEAQSASMAPAEDLSPTIADARPRRWAALLLAAVHLFAAPMLLVNRSFHPLTPWIEHLYVRIPMTEELRNQDVVIISAPIAMLAAYLPIRGELDYQCSPRHTRVLGPSLADIEVHRLDERTLRIHAPAGFTRATFDELFRSPTVPLAVGEQIHLTGLTITVERLTSDQRPLDVRFEWDRPLEDPSLRWLQWDHGRFVAFVPPPVGQTVSVHGRWPSLIR